MKFTGSLSADPEIPKLYRDWQLTYKSLSRRLGWRLRISIEAGAVNNVSEVKFRDLCQRLQNRINAWLNSESFSNINLQLRTHLNPSEEIRVIIETDDDLLRRLPWFLWNFFDHYPKAEVALSVPEYKRVKPLPKKTADRVRILAILGNSEGIDLQKDRAILEQLPKADAVFLVEPQKQELDSSLWDKQGWDILYFAGHSSSQTEGETGHIYINQTESLTIPQLKNALKAAITRGLRLAIFNSCDGLGLARNLADLQIPQMVVMREPVPDIVAQEFLKYFLKAFASGESFNLAVREARERLQGLEEQFLCSSWLPVIFQNPASVPPTWQEWLGRTDCDPPAGRIVSSHREAVRTRNRQIFPIWRNLCTLMSASLVVTGLVMGMRQLGKLQAWELKAYDQLMRLRPEEGPDTRLLVVSITDKDFQLPEQKQRKGSLSDLALDRLLQKLESYKPRAIGLDIFRAPPDTPKLPTLKERLKRQDNLFAICNVSDPSKRNDGISPPPYIPIKRQGFANLVVDSGDIVRRHLLYLDVPPTSPCTSPYALSVQLALHYLKAEKISPQFKNGDLQLGKVVFNSLRANPGAYQKADLWGNQVLLNYRSYRSPQEIADNPVTLTEVLRDKIKPEMVKDRIILIGAIHSTSDYFYTPYSSEQLPDQKMPGVIIQAQMVSQILSAVLDGRTPIRFLPQWGEVLWVWGWSLVGGVLAWHFRARIYLGLTLGITLGVMCGLCYYLLIRGYWVPLIPSALALVATGGSVIAYSASQTYRQQLTPQVTS
nr:CHASE2 domain-containing protein [Trichocoleus sp. FACHB-90]